MDTTVFSVVVVSEVFDEDNEGETTIVQLFRFAVPHGGDEKTALQQAVVRLHTLNVSSFTLLTGKEKPYKEAAYNTLAKQFANALEKMIDDDEEEDDDEDDKDEDEDDFKDDSVEEDKPPPPKKAKVGYTMPVVTELTGDVFSVDKVREPSSMPYKQQSNERHVFVLVRPESISPEDE